jgi:hypothetical protein
MDSSLVVQYVMDWANIVFLMSQVLLDETIFILTNTKDIIGLTFMY